MLWFVYLLQGEGKWQESKLQFRRLSYPSTPQRLKRKFLPYFNHALQPLKGNPHIFLIPRDWLVGQVQDSLWRIFYKLVETLCMDLLFCLSFLEIWNNSWPSPSELQLQDVITFDWKVIIEIPCAKTFQIYHWWPTKSLAEMHSRISHFAMRCRTSTCWPVITINHNYQFMKITGCKDTRNTILSEEGCIIHCSTILLIGRVARRLFKQLRHGKHSQYLEFLAMSPAGSCSYLKEA